MTKAGRELDDNRRAREESAGNGWSWSAMGALLQLLSVSAVCRSCAGEVARFATVALSTRQGKLFLNRFNCEVQLQNETRRHFCQRLVNDDAANAFKSTIFALSTPPGRGAIAIVRVSGSLTTTILRLMVPGGVPPTRMAVLRNVMMPEMSQASDDIERASTTGSSKESAASQNPSTGTKQEDAKIIRSSHLHSSNSQQRDLIDRCIVIFFPSPRSATGEDVAEFHLHGGIAVVKAFMKALQLCNEAPQVKEIAALSMASIAQHNDDVGHAAIREALPGEFIMRGFFNNVHDINQVEATSMLLRSETEQQRRLAMYGGDRILLRADMDKWVKKLLQCMVSKY